MDCFAKHTHTHTHTRTHSHTQSYDLIVTAPLVDSFRSQLDNHWSKNSTIDVWPAVLPMTLPATHATKRFVRLSAYLQQWTAFDWPLSLNWYKWGQVTVPHQVWRAYGTKVNASIIQHLNLPNLNLSIVFFSKEKERFWPRHDEFMNLSSI